MEISHKILENSGNFRQMLFVIFYFYLNELCTISENGSILYFENKRNKTKQNIKKYWKMKKKPGKVREFCHSGKVGAMLNDGTRRLVVSLIDTGDYSLADGFIKHVK